VFISYGCRSSDDFVTYYGFCPLENPHDTVSVEFEGAEFEFRAGLQDLEAAVGAAAAMAGVDETAAALLLADRIAAALAEYPTTIEEDEAADARTGDGEGGGDGEGADPGDGVIGDATSEGEGRAMLRRLRLSKKRALRAYEERLRSWASLKHARGIA